MKKLYLGVDTSNYTTSLSAIDEAGMLLCNLKAPLQVAEGERGLRQSDAVFAHIKNMPGLLEQLSPFLHPAEGACVCGVGYSASPRREKGSYMPCFLTGKAVATALSVAFGSPILDYSHQEGHIMAALTSAGAVETLGAEGNPPFAAFHISGGTTDLMRISPKDGRFTIELLGTSLDLHAGQAIDRIGVAMGLSFPAGPALEALARENTEKVPKPKICVEGFNCHLSGLENLAIRLWKETGNAPLTAAYTLQFLFETLKAMLKALREAEGEMPVLFAGGVMSNRILQTKLRGLGGVYFSEPALAADNAVGIAGLCRRSLLKK